MHVDLQRTSIPDPKVRGCVHCGLLFPYFMHVKLDLQHTAIPDSRCVGEGVGM